jgi:hypothetical protein
MDTSTSDLSQLVGAADPARVASAVRQLGAALDDGRYIEVALAEILADLTAQERVAILRVLEAPAVEEAELTAQRRADAGAAFLNPDASESERDESIRLAFPELCRDADDEDEEYELAG